MPFCRMILNCSPLKRSASILHALSGIISATVASGHDKNANESLNVTLTVRLSILNEPVNVM